MRFKAVIWDLGGVFLDWDPRYMYVKIFGDDVEGMEHFLSTVCTPDWHAGQDLGRDIGEACRELAAAHPAYAELVFAWHDRVEEMIRGVFDESVAVLGELKDKGVPCYAFSNMEKETYERRLGLYPFLNWFDGAFISGIEKVMKPDPRYFRRGLQRFGLAADEVIFIDDRALNVETAGALGMTVIWSRSPHDLRPRLARLGLLGPGQSIAMSENR